jgi:threonine synthase
MDVGAPSNFFRINALMGQPTEEIIADPKSSQMQIISGYSASEDETKEAMRTYYTKYGLLLDPHTAVGAAALKAYRTKNSGSNEPCILVATAHPAKFGSTVQAAVGITPPLPEQLETVLNKPEYVTSISTEYSSLRQRL